jgi:quercetin dioxygenase-like cupin family protein
MLITEAGGAAMRVSPLTSAIIAAFGLSVLGGCARDAAPHDPPPREHANTSPQEVACQAANGHEGQPGCWVLATAPVDASAALYWHVYEIGSVAQGSSAAPPARVFRAHGRTWLVAVADQHWKTATGRHIASVGPLQLLSAKPHTASFMEAMFEPGMSSRIHTHPGPEAWVVLEGEQCLETPEGVIRGRAGDSMMVRGGIPMRLFGTGTAMRKALVLIIHPTGEPLGATHHEWQPTGACLAK